jgi:hypothetical protein
MRLLGVILLVHGGIAAMHNVLSVGCRHGWQRMRASRTDRSRCLKAWEGEIRSGS